MSLFGKHTNHRRIYFLLDLTSMFMFIIYPSPPVTPSTQSQDFRSHPSSSNECSLLLFIPILTSQYLNSNIKLIPVMSVYLLLSTLPIGFSNKFGYFTVYTQLELILKLAISFDDQESTVPALSAMLGYGKNK